MSPEIYEKLFYVFSGMAVLSLGLSIFLFIRFDIPQTYAVLSGRARSKTIQEIEIRNAQTGRMLRASRTTTADLLERTERRQRAKEAAGKTGKNSKATSAGKKAADVSRKKEKQAHSAAVQPLPERLETAVLSTPAAQTTMLAKPTGITEDLARTEILQPAPDISFYFHVTENTVSIHTEELI